MPGGGMDEMEMMIDMFVDQAKIEDALFIKCGVQNEELEEAIMYFIGKDDPDVIKLWAHTWWKCNKRCKRWEEVLAVWEVWAVCETDYSLPERHVTKLLYVKLKQSSHYHHTHIQTEIKRVVFLKYLILVKQLK